MEAVAHFATHEERDGNGHFAFAGTQVRRLLSRSLFADVAGLTSSDGGKELHLECRSRWATMANRLAASPTPLECMMVLGVPESQGTLRREVRQAFLAIGRGATQQSATKKALAGASELHAMLSVTYDQVELESISDNQTLETTCALLRPRHGVEVKRRVDSIHPWHGSLRRAEVGFNSAAPGAGLPVTAEDEGVDHLFPWLPGEDSWEHLLAVLLQEGPGSSFVVHLEGRAAAPDSVQEAALSSLAAAERIARLQLEDRTIQTVLSIQAVALRQEALRRVSILQGRVLLARLFITSFRRTSQALLTGVLNILDSSAGNGSNGSPETLFHGGANLSECSAESVTSALDDAGIVSVFGIKEATTFLRTPIPAITEMPGMRLKRARTLPLTGVPGQDCPLGNNVHRGQTTEVHMDGASRFRHTYVIGQTGTGKSTLLLNMILHDLNRGRGVGVLDPHGCLIQDILERYPKERADDLVLVDLSDTDHPVGFNLLCIDEKDPVVYRQTRDLIIDDLYSFLKGTYMQETMGPVFESHLRSVLALLMGNEPPKPPLIPSLMVFRALYTNRALRKAMGKRVRGQDVVIDEFLDEAEAVSGECSLANMAPYITSKFSRFVTDVALRNVTCQNSTLDFDQIVASGKVLLVYLGKGRFGDHAAGLLAGQIVSRIRHAVMKRGTGRDNRPFYLYADEFQLFANERFAEMLAEARKFGLALTLAHQYVEQLPEKVLRAVVGNVGTLIALRVGARDGEVLAPLFRPEFTARDLMSQANFSAYIKSSGALGETPFSLALSPPPTTTNQNLADHLRNLSRKRYGRPRKQVEEEINEVYKAFREHE